MMKTPIYDFVEEYVKKSPSRFHMPGHKGKSFLGCEALDITEIVGADNLYSPDGIIEESENNATRLFGSAHTFYSAEGSTLAIKAMLAIAVSGCEKGVRPVIMAARNAHKSFIYACALLDIDVVWLYPQKDAHICSAKITADEIETALNECEKPIAVYLTSPDYLGNIADIKGISEVCCAHNIPLLVDNAHGAYLRFLEPSAHPISLGADMCCDSAHKTLPVLTGGAYLHISKSASSEYLMSARNMLSLFASTSPSYLVLESLDLCNKYIADGYPERLAHTVKRLDVVKLRLSLLGFEVLDTEPLKLVIKTCGFGYTGLDAAELLRKDNIEVEFFDKEYVVLMATPENSDSDFDKLEQAFMSFQRRETLCEIPSALVRGEKLMSIRDAVFSKKETVSIDNAIGRVSATPTVSCPPAIPIAVSGEVITAEAAAVFKKYNIDRVEVVK